MPARCRLLLVPARSDGTRLAAFLAARFRDVDPPVLEAGVHDGQVRRDGIVMDADTTVHTGDTLEIFFPPLAPTTDPPPLPAVLHEADGLVVLDKPAGMLCHPSGSKFTWALIGLARRRWPTVELVHRLDRDTSGCLALTTDPDLNRTLKRALVQGQVQKSYIALCKGEIPWDRRTLEGPIGPDEGRIRIKMRVREDGRRARTDVEVLDRSQGLTQVRCTLHTGRKHQIRLHLADAGHPLLGDRMYGVPPEVFLRSLEHGADAEVIAATGAARQALHAASLTLPHPKGPVHVVSPAPPEFQRWWRNPVRQW